LLKATSKFGAQMDSLADIVNFGVAPALVLYAYLLDRAGSPGWIAAFVYVAGAALRLARFNTLLEVADKRWFLGLPSPSAAALVAGFVWIVDDLGLDPDPLRWVAWGVTVFAGLTMVSNVRYWSFKTINLKKSVPFVAVVLIAAVVALLSWQPPAVLFALFVAYALSGYVVAGWGVLHRRRPPAA
jgi:CDP-diacylglycerol--serine O-phosphatidyltransferase